LTQQELSTSMRFNRATHCAAGHLAVLHVWTSRDAPLQHFFCAQAEKARVADEKARLAAAAAAAAAAEKVQIAAEVTAAAEAAAAAQRAMRSCPIR
jgi:hypothetical protein